MEVSYLSNLWSIGYRMSPIQKNDPMIHNILDFLIIVTILALFIIFYVVTESNVITTKQIQVIAGLLLSLPAVYILAYIICWITANKLCLLSNGRCKWCWKGQSIELNDSFDGTRDF